jgi:exodeoxyribonuclease VII large subunit
VGHETDVTLCDFVADARAATPSAAAEMAVRDRSEIEARVYALGSRLANGLTRHTRISSERLFRTHDRMLAAITRLRDQQHRRLDGLGSQLDALSPLRVLERGYSVARDETGRVLRRTGDFKPGLPFSLRVQDGEVPARAEGA